MKYGYDYAFLSFSKNIGRNTDKNISKSLSGKYSQKRLDDAKQSTRDPFETASKRAIQKTSEVTCDLTGNKIFNRVRKVLKKIQQDNSETVTNGHEKEKNWRHKIIDDLTLYDSVIMEYQKMTYFLENRQNQPTKFRTKNLVEINDNARGANNTY